MCVLREKLPAAEIEYAVEDALVDAGYKGKFPTSSPVGRSCCTAPFTCVLNAKA